MFMAMCESQCLVSTMYLCRHQLYIYIFNFASSNFGSLTSATTTPYISKKEDKVTYIKNKFLFYFIFTNCQSNKSSNTDESES